MCNSFPGERFESWRCRNDICAFNEAFKKFLTQLIVRKQITENYGFAVIDQYREFTENDKRDLISLVNASKTQYY